MEHIEFLKQIGAKGGEAGRGIKKVRGDSEYYAKIARMRGHKRRKTVKGAETVHKKHSDCL